jgi:N-acetylmuramoyl-L-alanine amidase
MPLLKTLAALLLLVCPAALAQSSEEGIIQLYDRAQRAYFNLKADADSSGDRASWLQVVNDYRLIIDTYPNDPLVDDITFITGGVYREMYELFGDRSYLEKAVAYYTTVLRDFPESYLQQAALFAIGEVQEEQLHRPEQALLTYNELVRRFPKGYKTAAARDRINELSKTAGNHTDAGEENSGNGAKTAGSESVITEKGTETEATGENNSASAESGPVTITDIRTAFGKNNGRVVIELSGEAKFNCAQLPPPNARVYFDIYGASLEKSNLKTDSFPISNRYLKRIRVGQFNKSTARVVLDFSAFRNYRVFTLPSPYRIVFDLYGVGSGPTLSAAKGESTSTAEKAEETVLSGADRNHSGRYSISRQLGAKVRTIVLDPGHGGKDPGAIGLSGLTEKELSLDVARRLKVLLEKELPGLEVKLTRNDDTFIPLEQRTAIATSLEADLFFSIHANSSPGGKKHGVETFYMNFATNKEAEELAAKENAYSQYNQSKLTTLLKEITLNNKKEESRELAGFIQANLYRHAKAANRNSLSLGVKSAPFIVLLGANVPSVLVEVSFMNHPIEGKLLHTDTYRDRIARGLLDGIKAYIESLQ